MYIKYLSEIHKVDKYYSVVRNGIKGIHLTKGNGSYQLLEFADTKAREFVLVEIWKELKNTTEFFDLDEIIHIYYVANKYNI